MDDFDPFKDIKINPDGLLIATPRLCEILTERSQNMTPDELKCYEP
jgi:hypothetical protein